MKHSRRHRSPSYPGHTSAFGVREGTDEGEALVFDCPSGKKGYRSKAHAKRALKEARRKGRSHRSIYDCDLCLAWHLTSQAQR